MLKLNMGNYPKQHSLCRNEKLYQRVVCRWLLTTQITDGLGALVVGNEIFETNSTKLYAKWLHTDLLHTQYSWFM